MRSTSYEMVDEDTGQVKRVQGWLESNCAYYMYV
jgi:hypothetical protein